MFTRIRYSLLNLCDAMICSILNEVKSFGCDNSETYISPTDCSTIGYFAEYVCTLNVLDSLSVESSCAESDHSPVSLTTKVARAGPQGRESAPMRGVS